MIKPICSYLLMKPFHGSILYAVKLWQSLYFYRLEFTGWTWHCGSIQVAEYNETAKTNRAILSHLIHVRSLLGQRAIPRTAQSRQDLLKYWHSMVMFQLLTFSHLDFHNKLLLLQPQYSTKLSMTSKLHCLCIRTEFDSVSNENTGFPVFSGAKW